MILKTNNESYSESRYLMKSVLPYGGYKMYKKDKFNT